MTRAISILRGFAADPGGLAAIELAIIAPIVVLSILCVADLGRYALARTWVTYAASAGAEYAAAHASSTFSATAISSAATSAAGVSGISVSPAPSQYYGCATATGVTASTQGASCPSSTSTGATAGQYVAVTATMPFAALFSAAGIAYPSTLASTAVVRTQ